MKKPVRKIVFSGDKTKRELNLELRKKYTEHGPGGFTGSTLMLPNRSLVAHINQLRAAQLQASRYGLKGYSDEISGRIENLMIEVLSRQRAGNWIPTSKTEQDRLKIISPNKFARKLNIPK